MFKGGMMPQRSKVLIKSENKHYEKYQNRICSYSAVGTFFRLREIIKYRNALVHGQDLIPSKIMLQKIDRISKEVESLLGSKD